MDIRQMTNTDAKATICAEILADLPDWFGIPESTAEYVRECQSMPFWASFEHETAVGFIALKETSPYACEIYVTGVKKDHHRHGIGRSLFGMFKAYAKDHGYHYLQVKTVQRGHYAQYDRTCDFYESLGFVPLECFPTLWDESNPCQIYILSVK